MKKVIVTGGAGFIGSHTCVELAAAGYEPIIVDDLRNSQERAVHGIARIIGRMPRWHLVDCTDEAAMERVFAQEGHVHGVMHFAAHKSVPGSVDDPVEYYRNNIRSMVVVVRTMQRHDVRRIVFSSSCTVYGEPDVLPVPETRPDRNATSPYGFTKVVCEQLLRDVSASPAGRELRSVLLRYFNPVGAHPSAHIGELPLGVPNNLVPFVTQAAAGLRPALTVFGDDYGTPDGSCIRDYIHVVDLARAHVAALDWMEPRPAPLCEVFNIGTGVGHSVLEVLRTFTEATGVDVPFVVGPRRKGDVPVVYADTRKSSAVLGWTSGLTLRDALRDAWRWQCSLKEEVVQ